MIFVFLFILICYGIFKIFVVDYDYVSVNKVITILKAQNKYKDVKTLHLYALNAIKTESYGLELNTKILLTVLLSFTPEKDTLCKELQIDRYLSYINFMTEKMFTYQKFVEFPQLPYVYVPHDIYMLYLLEKEYKLPFITPETPKFRNVKDLDQYVRTRDLSFDKQNSYVDLLYNYLFLIRSRSLNSYLISRILDKQTELKHKLIKV